MNHTPTPLEKLRNFLFQTNLSAKDRVEINLIVVDAVTKCFSDGQESCLTEIAELKAMVKDADYARAKACVNACTPFEDPEKTIPRMLLENELKDTEIAELKARVAELEQLLNATKD